MSWTDEKIKQLKKLWDKGLTTAEIGKKLDISKNAVVGKAHRLGLQARPSPIKTEKQETLKSDKKAPIEKKEAVKKSEKITIEDLKPDMCRFPIGDPRSSDFHFCGEKVFKNKPYCLKHCAEAYTSPKNKDS